MLFTSSGGYRDRPRFISEKDEVWRLEMEVKVEEEVEENVDCLAEKYDTNQISISWSFT